MSALIIKNAGENVAAIREADFGTTFHVRIFEEDRADGGYWCVSSITSVKVVVHTYDGWWYLHDAEDNVYAYHSPRHVSIEPSESEDDDGSV